MQVCAISGEFVLFSGAD